MGTCWNRLGDADVTSTHNLCLEQKYEKYQIFCLKTFSKWCSVHAYHFITISASLIPLLPPLVAHRRVGPQTLRRLRPNDASDALALVGPAGVQLLVLFYFSISVIACCHGCFISVFV